MRKSRQRLLIIASAAVVLSAATGLMVLGLRSQAAYFRTPSQLMADDAGQGRAVRVGGLVTIGSVHTADSGVLFELEDDHAAIEVAYTGVLPSLFREGQCVIAEGAVGSDGRFEASRVLAKHDEEYRAPEIEDEPRLARSCGPATVASAS
jgi:cytochrome c-type biogenesis protein CcmE